jgi:hypothetical protein
MRSEDLKTILQFIDKNDKQIKEEVTGDLYSLKESVFSIIKQLKEDIQNDPTLRGPPGFSGRDGDQGPPGPAAIGERGPMGPMPVIDIDYQSGRIRLQTGISENNGLNTPMFSEWINVKGEKGDTLTWHDLTESQRQMLIGPRGDQGPQGNPGKFPQMQADSKNEDEEEKVEDERRFHVKYQNFRLKGLIFSFAVFIIRLKGQSHKKLAAMKRILKWDRFIKAYSFLRIAKTLNFVMNWVFESNKSS